MKDEVIDFFIQHPDFQFGFQVYLVIVFASLTVFLFLAVLTHHDHRRLQRGNARQYQVKKDKRVSIKGLRQKVQVCSDPAEQKNHKEGNKFLASPKGGNLISQPLTQSQAVIHRLFHILGDRDVFAQGIEYFLLECGE